MCCVCACVCALFLLSSFSLQTLENEAGVAAPSWRARAYARSADVVMSAVVSLSRKKKDEGVHSAQEEERERKEEERREREGKKETKKRRTLRDSQASKWTA